MSYTIIEYNKGDVQRLIRLYRKTMKNSINCGPIEVGYLEMDYILTILSGALIAGIIKSKDEVNGED